MDIHPCHSIQIWIRLKKLYFHGKWQNHFTHKSVSTFIICRNFIWTKNWIYITPYLLRNFQINARNKLTAKCILTFSHHSKPHLESVKNKLGSQIYSLVYKFNVCFIRLENLDYQNNPSITDTVTLLSNHQYNMQHSINWILQSRYF